MWDQVIIDKFGLFCGQREKSEDERIFESLKEAVQNETARFVMENLGENVVIDNLEKDLEKIPFWRVRLNERINQYLAKIMVEAKEVHGRRATS